MIFGIGHDIVDIARIEKALERHGQRFLERCFTPQEQAKAAKRRNGGLEAATLAKRFAAKEATSKALGTGMASGVGWRDIEVIVDETGRPLLKLSGGAQDVLNQKTPAGYEAVLHLSLSDEPPLASAYVIIELVKSEKHSNLQSHD